MSSNNIAISARGLSKSYKITHNAPSHTTMGEMLMSRLKKPLQRYDSETFWALRDVDFNIKKGEVVGVMGRNGAGKSTLLKVLSQITEPTTGQVKIYGRVGSLLEVGTGFHPELTGRENIFLNGAILGMQKREIEREFDAIVDFAGVSQFLDTPVKRYSSGMYVRLAFAVAAHLNSEILVVDEVLAVGDSQFQKKCLGKMREVSQHSGRTVLFVSHNLESILSLCRTAILLKKGHVETTGAVEDVVSAYQKGLFDDQGADHSKAFREGRGTLRFQSVQASSRYFEPHEEKKFDVSIKKLKEGESEAYFSLHVIDEFDREIAVLDSAVVNTSIPVSADTYECSVKLQSPWLRAGEYRIDAYIYNSGIIDKFSDACRFVISPVNPYSRIHGTYKKTGGLIYPDFSMQCAN